MSLAQPEVEHVRGLIPRTYHNSPPFFASFESARQRPELNRGGLLKRLSSWYLLLRPQQQRYILCCEESDLFHSPWCKLCRSGLLFLHPHNPRFEREYPRHELKRQKREDWSLQLFLFLKMKRKKWRKKNQKQTKNEKTDYCNPSFYRNKREKRQNETKQTKQSEKQPKKHLHFWRKKKSVCMSGRKFCTPIGYEHVNWSQSEKKI